MLIEGRMISAVGADLADATGATVIDGGGRVLMPGIIEAHNHLSIITGAGSIADEH